MSQKRFEKQFVLDVPARSPIGPPPTREVVMSFTVPDGFRVSREGANFGARVAHVSFDGLTERRREFRSIENGVELTWKLSNGGSSR